MHKTIALPLIMHQLQWVGVTVDPGQTSETIPMNFVYTIQNNDK
jgi:hypothetical protein